MGLDPVAEQDEGEAGVAGGGLVVEEEFVEAVNGGLADGFHGAGAVEDEGDFSEHGEERWFGMVNNLGW